MECPDGGGGFAFLLRRLQNLDVSFMLLMDARCRFCKEARRGNLMLKLWKTALCAAGLSAFMAGAAYGGQWQQDDRGWRWQEEDGSYTANDWSWIDGNRDGVSECYCFGPDGYMMENRTTPDGFQVNENGAWVKDGAVQTAVQHQVRETTEDSERYTVIGGPNRLASPDGIRGIIPFDMNLYQEFRSGAFHTGTHIYRQNEYFAVPVEQYGYQGEILSLGAAQASGGSAYRFDGKLVIDHTKPDAVNGKTNIRYRYDDGTFAGYGFHAVTYSEEYLAENKKLRQSGDPNHLAYSGRGEHFFSEDGYMYRNCCIGSTSTKMGYDGGWVDRDYEIQ